MDWIEIRGARQHNLKNINLRIPHRKFVVVSGVSGSGKSSLVFDILYAEGQRRYVECLSPYARQFLELMPKPDVDSVEGLSPAISIDQKNVRWNPRSTVATSTEIYDYLRLLFARVGDPYCPNCKIPIKAQTPQRITDNIFTLPEGTKIWIIAPYIEGKKGEFRREFELIRSRGFSRVRVDGVEYNLLEGIPKLDKNKKHTVYIVVGRHILRKSEDTRREITASVEVATDISKGNVIVEWMTENGEKNQTIYSTRFACPKCSFSYQEISPRLFSFNSPYGACPTCQGLGSKMFIDEQLLVDPQKTIRDGAIRAFRRKIPAYVERHLERISDEFQIDVFSKRWEKLPEKVRKAILHGDDEWEGVINYLWDRYNEDPMMWWDVERYISSFPCPDCKGARLKPEALSVYIDGKNIWDVVRMTVKEAREFFEKLEFDEYKSQIASKILEEIRSRLEFISEVGLDYLTLDRESSTLSSGEAQRLKLAGQLGSRLVGVLYVLDEPTCGLHPRDISRLISTLKKLRDLGNTLVVVEHDRETIMNADLLIDLGEGGGQYGGKVVFYGTIEEAIREGKKKDSPSLTCKYLAGTLDIPVPEKRRKPGAKWLVLKGARGRNLKNVTLRIPLGLFVCITGVSGSGKSSLIVDTLYPAVLKALGSEQPVKPLEYDEIDGLQWIDKVILVDQSPLGRTPRSNPATYTGVFTYIRDLFASLPESRARGFTKSRFSFNVPGGRCEECRGEGYQKIEMHFLPDVFVTCKVCEGKRYNRDTLEVRYRGKNIADVLDMTVDEALEFFKNHPHIREKLQVLADVGLGYIKLGQPATTLSGGEAQRVRLAKELSRKSTGNTLYILDEPTTGLHLDDIRKLVNVLQRLVDMGNTVVVIEHNLDLIKSADWIIDLGPEGGDEGGYIIAEGPPEEVAKVEGSWTGRYLAKELERMKKIRKSRNSKRK